MNTVHIVMQGKDDPKDLVSTIEKARALPEGLHVIFIESATNKGQIGVQLLVKGVDMFGRETINTTDVTENNFEGIFGAFIAARMRWRRMPVGQFDLVNYYLREKFEDFMKTIPDEEKKLKDYVGNYISKM